MNIVQLLKFLKEEKGKGIIHKASRVDWLFDDYIYLGDNPFESNVLFCDGGFNIQATLRLNELTDNKWFIIKEIKNEQTRN